MSTYMAKAETVERKWYVLDAAGKSLGRTAVVAANILRGKHRPEFTPHTDCGEFVIIVNADKAVLTGKKLGTEILPPSLRIHRRTEVRTVQADHGRASPEFAMELAVKGMLPQQHHRPQVLNPPAASMRVADHKHEAQKPVAYDA